jgi:bifunctional NMN adenylyltransferase/nudix hydrolase
MRFDYLVFIGRFQPVHRGHVSILSRALDESRNVIVLIGSANQPRNIRNPWTTDERVVMLRSALGAAAERIRFAPLRDHFYNENAWIGAVQSTVARLIADDKISGEPRIGLIGGDDESAGEYLRAFPQWPRVEVLHTDTLSSTELRQHYFSGDAGGRHLLEANVPPAVFEMIDAFRTGSPAYAGLVEEFRFVQQYRKGWESAPYPPTFVTVDAVVVHSGHVLLVKRGAQPGKGLWALPGGFVREHESIPDAMLRELREETRLKIPTPVLRGSIKSREVFDHPSRSLRGRTITHAFHLEFPTGPLPPVKGGDDAAKARWFTLAEVRQLEEHMFEDHFYIVEHFIGTA